MAADMRFGLLGPVEVLDGSRRLPVDRPRQRAILAYLLLHANRAVSTDQLVNALWGQAGPATARTQVQNDVSIVRRILRSGGGEPVVTQPGGYLIRVGSGQLDAAEFTMAVARATAGAPVSRDAAALELRSALALWRGQAIADVSAAYAPPFRERLEEQRCHAYEQLFDLELAGGRHNSVIAELHTVIQEHPLRERFAAQLMLALYRSGRAAEALQVARELRRRLADQHGLDPGSELSGLELRILRNDGSLQLPGAPAGPAVHRPSQLPPDIADFVGRGGQLAALDSLLLASHPAVAAISGAAGVGKTALALRWAHRSAGHFPDGQLYVDMRGYSADLPLPPIDALSRFLRALGVDAARVPADLDEATAAYRTALAGRRVLVVVDNAHGVDQVRPLLPTAAGCVGLVTSRHRLDGLVALDAARPVTLDLLPADAALDLLSRILGGARLEAECAAADDLADACGYLPLALRIAAAQLAVDPEQTIASLLPRLQPGERLAALTIAGDSRASVATAFALSYGRLDPASRRAFGLLGVAPCADFSVLAVAALLGTAAGSTREALRELEVASLVDRHGDRFLMHDLVREYAATTLSPDEAAAGIGRYLAYLLRSASAAATLVSTPPVRLSLPPDGAGPRPDFADARAALDWLDAERANLVGAIRFAADGHQEYAWLLADVLRGYFRRGMHIGDWIGSAKAALSAVALADPAGRPQVEAISHLSLGLAYQATGRPPAAVEHFTTAQALAARGVWRDVEASALGNLGVMTWRAGDVAGAGALLEAAVGLAREAGNVGVEANNLGNLAVVMEDSGRLTDAADSYLALVPLFRRIGAREGAAHAGSNLCGVYRMLGRYEDAVRYGRDAADEFRAIGDASEAAALTHVADVHCDRGEWDEAFRLGEAAMAIARHAEQPYLEMDGHDVLSAATCGRGDLVAALDHASRQLRLAEQASRPDCAGRAYLRMAEAHLAAGCDEEAQASARQGLAAIRDGNFPECEARVYLVLSSVAARRGDHAGQAEHAGRAAAIGRRAGLAAVIGRADPDHTAATA